MKIRKIATYLMIGTLALTGKAAFAEATEIPEVGIAGITLSLDDFFLNAQNAEEEITQVLMAETAMNKDLAFAKVTSYVNIRSKSNEDSKILGKLYNNAAATIISEKKGWYKIKSGTVTGYIKSEFLLIGEEAEELGKTVGNRLARVNTTTLKVREKASAEATVLTLVPIDDELKVVKEKKDWVKISLGENEFGYVSSDYVELWTEYEEAVSIEEEQERLEEEAAAIAAEQALSSEGSNSSSTSGKVTSLSISKSSTTTDKGTSNSSLRSKIVQYALKFLGNAYVWGGTSLSNGTDCSGFTQSVFADFGISISRTSRTQATGGRKVSMDNLQMGDLIFYARNGTVNHVALYIGNGKVVSASSPSTGIRITSYNYRQPYKAVSYFN
ncbi:MAG: C40 family peptidase [Mobilitalea sp.]